MSTAVTDELGGDILQGVRMTAAEYWLIDPERRTTSFYRLGSGKYSETQSQANAYATPVIAGFVLDLAGLRRVFGGGRS